MRSRPASRSRDARAKSPSSSTERKMSRTRWAGSSPNLVSATCRALRSSSTPPSASSISLICIDNAGCEIAQASAARPKWP